MNDPLTEKDLDLFLEKTYEAERYFFPEDSTQTYSGKTYDLIVEMGTAIRELVAHIRKQQEK